jgi:hypothetical protein
MAVRQTGHEHATRCDHGGRMARWRQLVRTDDAVEAIAIVGSGEILWTTCKNWEARGWLPRPARKFSNHVFG